MGTLWSCWAGDGGGHLKGTYPFGMNRQFSKPQFVRTFKLYFNVHRGNADSTNDVSVYDSARPLCEVYLDAVRGWARY